MILAIYTWSEITQKGKIYFYWSDVRGATLAGWTSILVRSGIFEGEANDHVDPANYVVADLSEAFELILSLENIKQSWSLL